MTVSTTTSRADYTGNGTTTAFTVPFYFLDNTHLTVLRTQISSGVVTTLALTTDYTVTGAGVSGGGTVTCVTAPTSDQRLSVLRNVPLTQLIHYVENDPFPAASHERALDQLTMEMQQISEVAGRALQLSPNTPAGTASTSLPTPASNKLIAWNETASGLQNVDPTTLATIVAYGTSGCDIFSGNGVQTVFTLSANPGALYSLDISIGGVDQRPGIDYTWTGGTALTFTSAPPLGTNNIKVRYMQGLPQGYTDSASSSFLQAGTGAVTRNVRDKLRDSASVSVKDFGAVGDDSDESAKLQYAMTVAAGNRLVLEPGKIYRSVEELVMQPNTVLDLNGSTLRFACVGAKRNLAVASGCEVINGTVENVVGSTGYQGTYQTPIVIGQYTNLTGVSNVLLQNLTVSTVLAQGNGIAVFGDSHDITIDNIKFPDSDKIGIPVLVHWSFNGGATGPYTGTTAHPHNIKISNIRCGDLTYNAGAGIFGTSAVFLSAAYNIDVSNIYAKSVLYGKILTVYAGDWGFQFGTTLEQALGLGSISVTNLYGKALIGAQVYNKNPLEAVKKVWPGRVVISNANVSGVSTNSESKGVRVEGSDNVRASFSVFDGFYQGVYIGSEVTEFSLTDSTVRNSARAGYQIDGTTGVSKLVVDSCRFTSNNTGVAASIADAYFANAAGVVVRGCEFNSANCAWSVRAENTVTRLRLIDNHVAAVGAGAAFSLGAQTDVAICIQYQGNTSAVSPTNGVRGGQLMIPAVISTKHGTSSDQARISYYTTSPDRGTWAVGDRVLNATPAVGQPKGWICTVAGTPGTWVSEGNL